MGSKGMAVFGNSDHVERRSLPFPRLFISVGKSGLRTALAFLVGLFCAGTEPALAQSVPTGFTFEPYLISFFDTQPIGFTFLPDGRLLVIEKTSGNIRLKADGSATSVVIGNIPDVDSTLERGLLGIAVDPGWPARPYVYFYYSHVGGTNRVTMLTASGDLSTPTSSSIALAGPFDLLHIPNATVFHNGGTLRFGNDGMLYASCGEDLDRCASQDPTSLLGKLMRLDVSSMPGAGSGPPPKTDITPSDNPFPGPDENEKLVYALGFRNPFRFTFDSLTGDLFLGDVGGVKFEEVDLMPASSGGGQNFGWPRREGFGLPENPDTCGSANPLTDPIYDYPHDPPGPYSIIGGPLYRPVPTSPVSFPASYDGSYFFLDFNGEKIRRIVDTGGTWALAPAVAGQPTAEDWATGLCLVSDFQEGPDGALYLVTLGCALQRGVYRIIANGPVDAPVLAPESDALRVSARPNPVRPGGATIEWTLPRQARATLRIHDVTGRTVRTLVQGTLPAGAGGIHWDGLTEDGRAAPSGTYLFRLQADGQRAGGKLSLLR